jgi:hypothetical protein
MLKKLIRFIKVIFTLDICGFCDMDIFGGKYLDLNTGTWKKREDKKL